MKNVTSKVKLTEKNVYFTLIYGELRMNNYLPAILLIFNELFCGFDIPILILH